MNQIVIASKNPEKIREIKNFLHGLNTDIKSIEDFPDIPEITEDGKTFEENALKKSKIVFDRTKITTIADDSGLEVTYLNNRPGVLSKRYSGQNANDLTNNMQLLEDLKGVNMDNRRARFKCLIALHNSLYNGLIFEGKCEGYLIEEMKGENGFGYDSLFIPEGFNKTFAELDLVTKNKISHRGKALSHLRDFLERTLK
jgi:XTP/dITP diphosphohydrolase